MPRPHRRRTTLRLIAAALCIPLAGRLQAQPAVPTVAAASDLKFALEEVAAQFERELMNSGKTSSVAYVSNTTPIPDDKYSLAASTALAGEMLGLKLIYLDAGSGAEKEIQPKMISAVRKTISVPLLVGGGINTPVKAQAALEAGADLIVIGNALEKDPELLSDISERVWEWNQRIETRN